MSRELPDPKNWREVRDELRDLGALLVRTNGSHESWRFEDGETFVVVRNHLGRAVPLGIIVKFRRLRARRREPVDPALLGRTRPWWSRPTRDRKKVDHGQGKQRRWQGRWPEGRRRSEGWPRSRRQLAEHDG